MLKLSRNLTRFVKSHCTSFKRCFLSEAYNCSEAWENRLNAPIFQKIRPLDLYTNLEHAFSIGHRICVLDVDLLVNSLNSDKFVPEVIDVLLKLRLNPETSIMFESTSHAAIRYLLNFGERHQLLDILSERLKYGLFPDTYLSIYMMNEFLKENDVVSAVKVAVLSMLQEDCNYPILKPLGLYSCMRYLNSSEIWSLAKEVKEENEDEDEEIVKVRIPFLRNDYFDDQFDLVVPNHLVGKTMFYYGKFTEGAIGFSSQLLGLVLYEKFSDLNQLLKEIIKADNPVYEEAIEKAQEYLKNVPKQLVQEDEGGQDQKEAPAIDKNIDLDECKKEVSSLLSNLKNTIKGNLEEKIKELVEKDVAEHEKRIISEQCKVYKQWEEEREENIVMEMEQNNKRKTLMDIEALKKELEEEEHKIFFFDHEDEHSLMESQNLKKMNELVKFKLGRNEKKLMKRRGIPIPSSGKDALKR